MDDTPNLALPYIAAAQAQKHVTHNEALRVLDAIVQIAIKDRDLAAPPVTPQDGDRYIVPASGASAWGATGGSIAAFQDGAWITYAPQAGWLAWIADEQALVVWTGSAWAAAQPSLNPASRVGVNTTADTTNRLAVKSNAVLFSHDDVTPGTGDVRIAVNKAAADRSASLLFQTGYSGRAEIGLNGSDTFRVRMSADGTAWRDPLVITASNVGVGNTAPGCLLDVSANTDTLPPPTAAVARFANANGVQTSFICESFANNGDISLRRSNGRAAAPSSLLSGDNIGQLSWAGWGGGTYSAGRVRLQGTASENWTATAQGADFEIGVTAAGSVARAVRFRVEGSGLIRPGTDNAQSLGSSSFRWSQVWAANGTIQTSDARDKVVTSKLSGAQAAAAVDAIEPVLFRWKVGGYDLAPSKSETEVETDGDGTERAVPKLVPRPRPGKRVHAGFVAQDVKQAMDAAGVDFGVWGLDDPSDPDSRQWLRPDQIIPVLWAALRETRAEVARLQRVEN